jgi:7-carboxy-7-deazaguanine synthase
MDVKCPSSREQDQTAPENWAWLRAQDEVKFVIGDEEDYRYAKAEIKAHLKFSPVQITFSPIWSRVTLDTLAAWILKDDLQVRLGVQLHKVIWPSARRAV